MLLLRLQRVLGNAGPPSKVFHYSGNPPLTSILSPGGGEEFLEFPLPSEARSICSLSPFWGEGPGEGTFEPMTT